MPDPGHGFIEIRLPSLAVAAGLPTFAWIDMTLPALEGVVSAIVTDYDVYLPLPSLDVSFNVLASNSGNIHITLDPPSIDLGGAGHLSITLPPLSSTVSTLTATLLRIAAVLPVPEFNLSESHDALGWIKIELPTLTGSTHLVSTNQGHIAAALPLPSFAGRAKTGNIGHLDIDLPFLFYDSTLTSAGLLDIAITLPCLITTASGDSEPATIAYRTVVMNTMNFGVTEYGDLTLKGMTDVFGKTIAINANDLVSFGSTLDDTLPINATLQTGTIDFSNKFFVKPRDIWITLRSGKKLRLIMKENEVPDQENTYYSEPFVDNLHKTRIKVGRGFYAEFFDMTFQNIDGELIDIKDIHIFSETVPGRKR